MIRRGQLSQYSSLELVEHLLKNGEYGAAGEVLEASRQNHLPHALSDELYTSWLWCVGRKSEALCHARDHAVRGSKSYLYVQLGALEALSGRPEPARQSYDKAAELARAEKRDRKTKRTRKKGRRNRPDL